MAKRRNGNGGKGNNNHYPGRPSMCEKVPGDGSCLEQLYSPRPRICRNCHAPEIMAIKIKVFGQ